MADPQAARNCHAVRCQSYYFLGVVSGHNPAVHLCLGETDYQYQEKKQASLDLGDSGPWDISASISLCDDLGQKSTSSCLCDIGLPGRSSRITSISQIQKGHVKRVSRTVHPFKDLSY